MMNRNTTPTPQPALVPLILVIPQSALDKMPAATVAGIRGCEAQYHRGTWYVTVPPETYRQWPRCAAESVTA